MRFPAALAVFVMLAFVSCSSEPEAGPATETIPPTTAAQAGADDSITTAPSVLAATEDDSTTSTTLNPRADYGDGCIVYFKPHPEPEYEGEEFAYFETQEHEDACREIGTTIDEGGRFVFLTD